jgi:uncharacterized protein YllA (UPF0747 family)
MEINFIEAPGIPQSWLDFVSHTSPHSLLEQAASAKIQKEPFEASDFFIPEERWRSSRTAENIRKLQLGKAVAVVAVIDASLFGGALSQALQCLTAIKVSEELTRQSTPAVPVCWIRSESRNSVTLPDGEGELRCISIEDTSDFSRLISRIEEFGRGACDPDVLRTVEMAYSKDARLDSATARLFSEWMKEWGLVALHPLSPSGKEPLLPRSSLPAVAAIIGPETIQAFHTETVPVMWPVLSATILDSRSRKVLEKYKLSLRDLFAGEEEAFNKVRSEMPPPDKLSRLRIDVVSAMAEIESLCSAGDDFLRTKNLVQEKILYQIDKLATNLITASEKKSDIARRRLHRACNLLLPNGQLQERALAWIYFLLRYSSAILIRLYEQLDWTVWKHQLILMD